PNISVRYGDAAFYRLNSVRSSRRGAIYKTTRRHNDTGDTITVPSSNSMIHMTGPFASSSSITMGMTLDKIGNRYEELRQKAMQFPVDGNDLTGLHILLIVIPRQDLHSAVFFAGEAVWSRSGIGIARSGSAFVGPIPSDPETLSGFDPEMLPQLM